MIKVTRQVLLASGQALQHLGEQSSRVFGSADVDHYAVSVFSIVQQALYQENKKTTARRLDLIMELGQRYLDDHGLEQFQVPPSREAEYQEGMDRYMGQQVEIDCGALDGTAPYANLSIADRAQLAWLLSGAAGERH